jgi:hypothetical protein
MEAREEAEEAAEVVCSVRMVLLYAIHALQCVRQSVSVDYK